MDDGTDVVDDSVDAVDDNTGMVDDSADAVDDNAGVVDDSEGTLSLPCMDDSMVDNGLVLWLPYTDGIVVTSWTSSLSSCRLLGMTTGPSKSKLSGGGIMDS